VTAELDDILTPQPAHRIVTGTVRTATEDVALVDLPDGRTAKLPVTEFYPNRTWEEGARYHLALVDDNRNRPLVSAAHPDLIAMLLDGHAPEVRDGRVRVMGSARRVGIRSKVAVAATEEGVDPVGACLGRAAVRVKTITALLLGERVDIVAYHPDPVQYAINALAVRPLETAEGDSGELRVVVPEHQLAAAKGGGSLNVTLASHLVGRHLDIVGG